MTDTHEATTKYRIAEIMGTMPFPQRVDVRREICKKLQVSSQRLSQIINSVGNTSASEQQLEIIAQELGCEVQELVR